MLPFQGSQLLMPVQQVDKKAQPPSSMYKDAEEPSHRAG